MTQDIGQRSPRSRGWWLWIGYWGCLFVVMHVPIETGGSPTIEHVTTIAHFAFYYLLTWLGGRYLLSTGRGTVAVLLTWAVVYAVYAAADEWLQQFVGRVMSLSDWLADLAGIALATVTLIRWRRPAPRSGHGESTR